MFRGDLANPDAPRQNGEMRLGTVQDLRSVYRQPGRGPIDKVIHRLDHHCADFLSKSPFFVLSTANADGVCDGSPKGGPPGFVEVLDEQRLAWADYSGNNRLDSFENLVTNDSVALLFLIPGLDETLRVNGTAELVTEPALCERFTVGDKPARVVVVVTVTEAYVHCAKALRRAELWSPDSWLEPGDLPSGACIVKDHAQVDVDVAVIDEARAQNLRTTLWEPGGGL
jgi:PPOX class probable FMN-dependent enzyme